MVTQQPQPLTERIREEILAALSAAGAFCGACGFEPGEIGCADCVRVRELYADALAPITDRLRAELEQAQQLHAEVHLYDHAEGCPHPEPDDDQPEQGDAWAARHPYGMDGEGYTADRICLDLPWGQSVCATCIDPDHAPRLHVWPCPTATALGTAPAAVSGA